MLTLSLNVPGVYKVDCKHRPWTQTTDTSPPVSRPSWEPAIDKRECSKEKAEVVRKKSQHYTFSMLAQFSLNQYLQTLNMTCEWLKYF